MSNKRNGAKQPLTISLCVIARDEEQFIGDCIDSARPFVQEVVVLDTGSTDRTREIARQHGARVVEFTWCDDFAAARNAAIDVARTDWILMLDADERLAPEGGNRLAEYARMAPVIANGINGFCPRIVSQSLDGAGGRSIASRVMRFFPRLAGLRWVGAIHEDLQYVPAPSRLRSIALDAVQIVHFGYDRSVYAARGKDARNTRLLEQEFARQPDDARTLYFLGQQHVAMGRYQDAIPYFTAFLERAENAPPEFTVEVFAMLIKSLAAVGDLEGVAQVARRGEDQHLLCATAREELATVEEKRQRYDAAEQHLLRALEPAAQPLGVTVDEGIGSWATRLHLAQVHEKLQQPAQALCDLEAAFGELGDQQRGHVALEAAALALRCSDFGSAERWLERSADGVERAALVQPPALQRLMELRLDLLTRYPQTALASNAELALEKAVASSDWQTAYDAALRLAGDAPGYSNRLLHVAGGLKQAGAPEAVLDVLERLLDAAEMPEAAYWLLLSTLTELGRFEEADTTLELMRFRRIAPEIAQAA